MTLECTEKGGEMLHLVKKSTERETLYQGNQGWSGRNPSLFPMVGNTYTKDYEIDGKKYAMKNHGLIRYATLKGDVRKNELVFSLDANEQTLAQYPFNFHFEIGYKLDDEFSTYTLEFEKEENTKQLLFDPSYEKNVEYQDVASKEWKLSRDDVKKYATIIYKDLKSSFVTLKHGDEDVVRVSIEGYPYLALWTHDSASDFLCIEPWYSHGDFEKETPDFYHREGTMILKPNEEWSCSYWIEVL